MITLPSKSFRLGYFVMVALLGSVLLAACGAQATAAPEPATAATSAPANAQAPAADAATPTGSSAPASGAVSFSKDVLPILQSRCVSCHGGERTSKGLSMTSYDGLMAGSDNGAVVVAKDASNSLLIQLVQAGKMPKRGPKLLPEQLQMLIDWVNAGALNN